MRLFAPNDKRARTNKLVADTRSLGSGLGALVRWLVSMALKWVPSHLCVYSSSNVPQEIPPAVGSGFAEGTTMAIIILPESWSSKLG